MSYLHIAYYTFLKNIRDWKFILLLLAAPLLTIAITGSATLNSDRITNSQKAAVAYYDADSGQLAKQFDSFLTSKETQAAFEIKAAPSYEAGMKQVKDGKAEAFIYVRPGFSESFLQGEKTKIEVYGAKSLSASQLLVEGFINNVNASSAVRGIGGDVELNPTSPAIDQIAISATGKAPNGFDKWTYLNMLLILFYGAMLGTLSVINNRQKKTLLRFDVSPINRFASAGGQLLGNSLSLFAFTLLIILVTRYAFGSNWQGSPAVILLTFLLFSGIATAIGMIIGYLVKRTGLSILLIVCLNILLGNAAVATSIQYGNVFFEWIDLISPHYYGYLALTDSIFNGPASRIQSSLFSLAIGAIALASLTLFLGRRKPA